MKSRLCLPVAAAAVLGLALAVPAAFGQGAGNYPLASAQGTDVISVQRGANPVYNTLTINQLANFVNQGDSTPRNVLLGGDFTTNPFQSGTSQAANIANAITTGPDGWRFLGGASSAIQWSQQTGAADVPTGFGASLRFQRASTNADTTAVCVTQVLESAVSARFQGQTAVLSFWALDGANFSAASGNVQATIAYGTGSNQSAANFLAGSWTNQTNAVQTNVATSATWTRYTVSGAVPTTVSSSNVNQVGIKFCWTPVGTAGANDWVELAGIQLEVAAGIGAGASPFDYHLTATELNVSQRRLFVINEPASGIGIGTGLLDTTTTCLVTIAFPDTMAASPTVSFAGSALSGTTWQVRKAGATSVLATPFLAANTGHSVTNMNLTATLSVAGTAGQACVLQGAGGGGKIVVSAEL